MKPKEWSNGRQHYYKKIIIITLTTHKKKLFRRKIIVGSITIFPANWATFEDDLIFCASFWTFWTPITQKRDMMWYDFSFVSAQHIAHLLCKDDHFWEGGGWVCRSVVGTMLIYHRSGEMRLSGLLTNKFQLFLFQIYIHHRFRDMRLSARQSHLSHDRCKSRTKTTVIYL